MFSLVKDAFPTAVQLSNDHLLLQTRSTQCAWSPAFFSWQTHSPSGPLYGIETAFLSVKSRIVRALASTTSMHFQTSKHFLRSNVSWWDLNSNRGWVSSICTLGGQGSRVRQNYRWIHNRSCLVKILHQEISWSPCLKRNGNVIFQIRKILKVLRDLWVRLKKTPSIVQASMSVWNLQTWMGEEVFAKSGCWKQVVVIRGGRSSKTNFLKCFNEGCVGQCLQKLALINRENDHVKSILCLSRR